MLPCFFVYSGLSWRSPTVWTFILQKFWPTQEVFDESFTWLLTWSLQSEMQAWPASRYSMVQLAHMLLAQLGRDPDWGKNVSSCLPHFQLMKGITWHSNLKPSIRDEVLYITNRLSNTYAASSIGRTQARFTQLKRYIVWARGKKPFCFVGGGEWGAKPLALTAFKFYIVPYGISCQNLAQTLMPSISDGGLSYKRIFIGTVYICY